MKWLIRCLTLICGSLAAHPFNYDLHLTSIPGTNSRTMLCMHGYGSSYQIAQELKCLNVTEAWLISFNFPDHDLQGTSDPKSLKFGTLDELLPPVYVLKKLVVDEELQTIDLYGFSAGGGALVNMLAVLNSSCHDQELEKIGVGTAEKRQILQAVQRGLIILDTPLKSVDEILDSKRSSFELEVLAQTYRQNGFRPIDSLERLNGLSLNLIIHFQKPDEILSNRDDNQYIERAKRANQLGTTSVVIGHDGGHNSPHPSLWQFYSEYKDSL